MLKPFLALEPRECKIGFCYSGETMTGNKTATTAIFRFITAVAVLVSAVAIYCIVAGKQNNAELRELVGEADARGQSYEVVITNKNTRDFTFRILPDE